ncbi:MAG: SDR family oxidoreductase [Paracoccaceae bacterium]|nr:SDR family oxidoreductase [Paracoccaceae bacterium]
MTKGAVLILGGRSDMGLAIAHAFAAEGHPIQLAARGSAGLEADRADLALRHSVAVSLHDFDVLDTAGHEGFIDALPALPEVVVCAVGAMGDQAADEHDIPAAVTVMRTNFEGPAAILAAFANRFEARRSGTIVGISSVAGERGRATNYIYGSAKAGFTAFLSGLRNRLAGKGVHVVTVLPGFVATRMTAGMDLPAKLTAQPSEVGRAVLRAVKTRRNVIYVRPIWQVIMAVIRNIPEGVFKGMKI